MIRKLLFIASMAGAVSATAQTTKKPATPAKNTLRFRTTWNNLLADSLPRPDIIAMADSPLVVWDNKKNKYPVVSFEFTHESREIGINDTTNKPVIYTDFTGEVFKTDRLSPIWAKHVKETIQPGHVLYFNNIIVKYAGDKLYMVPAMKFFVR
ncbi:hypothetical protein MKQ68_03955 [Chitinophaga horti]|uniref:Uncharacterized protein n=1 Tax=Chitinophaga horti TaxID=2920382 RepID=A0ABY6J7H2_9BACT|nr:hypothetical protein [Chitinophaga horti]UYQ94244.1 hypothetical protein MKQ68_03955 [Chitinophaga horti]